MSTSNKTIWDAALATIRRLRDAGHQALLAGGCVRDMLLERTPKDYDVATDAVPDRVLELFPRARKVGVKFGVVLTRKFGYDIEVATFRSDGDYSDGRRPDSVTFGDAEQDARRRDFTVNGLFYDPFSDQVIDYVNGQEDLQKRIIRTIGNPDLRFEEDHLRMLRAVRFASVLDFALEAATQDALIAHAPRLEAISTERIWMELQAILSAPTRTKGWALLTQTGLCDHLAPGWTPTQDNPDAAIRRLASLPAIELDPTVGLSAVLLERRAAEARRLCRALKMSNRDCESVAWMLTAVSKLLHQPDMELADLKMLMAHRDWTNALHLLRTASGDGEGTAGSYDHVVARARAIPGDRIAPPPLLTGDELIALGARPGRRLGEIVHHIRRAQLNEEITTVDQARAMARHMISERE